MIEKLRTSSCPIATETVDILFPAMVNTVVSDYLNIFDHISGLVINQDLGGLGVLVSRILLSCPHCQISALTRSWLPIFLDH